MKKRNEGFTLVELIVAIAISTLVTAAATSVLLMGMQVNRQSVDTASKQMTVRALLDVMESAVTDGKISSVVMADDFVSWELIGKDDADTDMVIFSYDAATQAIYAGKAKDTDNDGKVDGIAVLKDVYASNAFMSDRLLNIYIENKDGIYTSRIYCRAAAPTDTDGTDPDMPSSGDVAGDVGKFLDILKSQYCSRGEIQGEYTDAGKYFSEWYIGSENFGEGKAWNADTPWCACYVSWALYHTIGSGPVIGETDRSHWFANVDEFIDYFQTDKYGTGGKWIARGAEAPQTGDLIFFDWDKGTDPEHVGVVLSVSEENRLVYTIEGNSAGRVTLRTYSLGDPRIIGYGRIFA